MNKNKATKETTNVMYGKISAMVDQIQLMYSYINCLEDSEEHLSRMLFKYHDDNCNVCNKAYLKYDYSRYKRGVFNGCVISAKDNWVHENK